MDLLIINIVFIIFIAGIFIWARAKVRKVRREVNVLTAEAHELCMSGRSDDALQRLYKALQYIVGIGRGTTEWTPRGICARMNDQGWNLVAEIEKIQKDLGFSYDWSEFKQIVNDFQQFSKDKKLVSRYGLPKKAGQEIYTSMRKKLAICLDSMPGVDVHITSHVKMGPV